MKRGALIATLLARAAADCTIDDTTPVTIIAGASHAGADTLHDSLRKALALPDRKRNEVHHFNDVASYGKGNDHYWQSLGCTGDSMVDESPGYLAHSVALLRAASQVPRARWVVLLREPVERALSHFMHLPRKQGGGQGSLKGFMEAIEEERSCIDAALHARAAHGHADITHESGDALYPRLAARYAFEHCADHLPGGGRQARAHGSAHFGKEHGLLSLSLYAPQLEHAARMASKMDLASPLVVVTAARPAPAGTIRQSGPQRAAIPSIPTEAGTRGTATYAPTLTPPAGLHVWFATSEHVRSPPVAAERPTIASCSMPRGTGARPAEGNGPGPWRPGAC